ncbi:hypothetical protein NHF50_03385 [Flavobacterium sp. NRK F10]|uniref:hypothetical protein n=1 Tax=Flavobacterium sp. NRK F10 TaxID=2954931 RepID=UPI0020912034|nr:hypothetical protein [Flavobacterium sp. NRK F10]MCO6174079.1 hypothetical protein [Flavobacterium sp. NRK F10]
MKKIYFILVLALLQSVHSQSTFPYDVVLTPVTVTGLPGLHSYAFGQHNGKWLIVGGRKDGIHARQPFNAFPENQNNTDLYVVDPTANQFWSASVNVLPTGLQEQLQSTNMNFYQDGDTLYIIGGYAFATSANDHITHDKLTAVDVPGLITAIVNNTSISPYFKQITAPEFAITGGQLGKIGTDFYLVGGHRFDGRYNPMNGPSFTQTYSNAIRKFQIDNSGTQLSISNYTEISDATHLHRRDYNLVPQVFPDGELGYTISSGVFQISVDLPFLYPVDIKAGGYIPQTQFNQYLSNYHSGSVGLYNATLNEMHSLFFGGMSQYYYQNGTLIQDDTVPFVKTISRVSRLTDGTLEEYQLPVEMPALKGSGAEFIPNKTLPHYTNEVIQLANITANEFVIGHLYGGILTSSVSAFTDNQTDLTSADTSIYEVKLVYNPTLSVSGIDGSNPFTFKVHPNPTNGDVVKLTFNAPYAASLEYLVMSIDGKIISDGIITDFQPGNNSMSFDLESPNDQVVILTLIFDNKFFVTHKVIKN